MLLEISDLKVYFDVFEGEAQVVNGVNLRMEEGETVALVGETGCGKSVTVRTLLGILPMPPGKIVSGQIRYKDLDLLEMDAQALHKIRGHEIALISFPASVGMRTKTGWYLGVALNEALASVLRDRVQAAGGLMSGFIAYGFEHDGQPFNACFFNAGGMGGGSKTDGLSTTIHPSSASNVPVELFEVAAPLLVHEKTFAADSGGDGQYRGGLCQRMTVSRLPDFDLPVNLSVWPHRHITPATGLLHGESGIPAQVYMNGQRLSPDEISKKTGHIILKDDELTVTVQSAGGGGFGKPESRDLDLTELDLRSGFVNGL